MNEDTYPARILKVALWTHECRHAVVLGSDVTFTTCMLDPLLDCVSCLWEFPDSEPCGAATSHERAEEPWGPGPVLILSAEVRRTVYLDRESGQVCTEEEDTVLSALRNKVQERGWTLQESPGCEGETIIFTIQPPPPPPGSCRVPSTCDQGSSVRE